MARVISVRLEEHPLSDEELEQLLLELERRVRSAIERRLRRRLDELDIVITADLKNGGRGLDLLVDVRAVGRIVAPMSYDEIVAEAIDEAVNWLAETLHSRRAQKSGKGDDGANK